MNWDDCSRDQEARPYFDERDAIFELRSPELKPFRLSHAAIARRICGNCVGWELKHFSFECIHLVSVSITGPLLNKEFGNREPRNFVACSN